MGLEGSVEALVKKALFLAQIGDTSSARELASQARHHWRTEDSAKLTVDLMLVDGICASYSGELASAFDRLNRACVLASMMGDDHRTHLGKAWQATVSFNLGQLASAEKLLSDASKSINGVGPNALFRSATVIVVLLQFCGEELAATRWLKFAQRAASGIGHPSLLSHLLYNFAAIRVSTKSYLNFFGNVAHSAASLDALAVSSSVNFDNITATSVQSTFHHLVEAQIFSIREDYSRAYSEIEKFLAKTEGVASEFVAQARFERLFLMLNLKFRIFSEEVQALEGDLLLLKTNDDLAKAHFILNLVARASGDDAKSLKHLALALKYRDIHSKNCSDLVSGLTQSGLFDVPRDWWALV